MMIKNAGFAKYNVMQDKVLKKPKMHNSPARSGTVGKYVNMMLPMLPSYYRNMVLLCVAMCKYSVSCVSPLF